jgi:hypothetical protein
MKFIGIVMLVVMSFCGALQAKEKDRKPSQTGSFGKDMDPKSAAMFQCLRDTETYLENTPILKDYRAILMKKKFGADKAEAKKAEQAWQRMDDAITALRLDPCEIVIDEKFPR